MGEKKALSHSELIDHTPLCSPGFGLKNKTLKACGRRPEDRGSGSPGTAALRSARAVFTLEWGSGQQTLPHLVARPIQSSLSGEACIRHPTAFTTMETLLEALACCVGQQVPLFLSSRICPPRKYSYLHYMHFID